MNTGDYYSLKQITDSVFCEQQDNILLPIFSCGSVEEYQRLCKTGEVQSKVAYTKAIERKLVLNSKGTSFYVPGFCLPCSKKVSFLVDMKFGGIEHENSFIPNWRERLVCPICNMNNRQRLIASIVKQRLIGKTGQSVYFMEQTTPIFKWAANTFKDHKIIGSEYLGHEYQGGQMIGDIRHESIENLSFADGQFDLIVSNDVFEHVPNPVKAFEECARVLESKGVMVATIPFDIGANKSQARARLLGDRVEFLCEPVYHGNPISEDGSLVFNDFGWDLIDLVKNSGFRNVSLNIYRSNYFGHLGDGQLIFCFSIE